MQSLGKILPEQQAIAKQIIEKKLIAIRDKAKASADAEEKEYYLDYEIFLEYKLDKVMSEDLKLKY
jgi:hypothetical protein